MKRSLMASGKERNLGIKTSQECETHRCACRGGRGRRGARGRTLRAASLAAVVCLGSTPVFGVREGQLRDQLLCVSTSCFLQRRLCTGIEEPLGLSEGGTVGQMSRGTELLEPLRACGQGLPDVALRSRPANILVAFVCSGCHYGHGGLKDRMYLCIYVFISSQSRSLEVHHQGVSRAGSS